MKRIAFLFVLLGFIAGCDKEQTQPLPTSKGVYVINEGLYNFGQGEVSFYDPVSNQVTNNLFHAANNYSLGDVAQSMYIKDSVGFIVVNNSAKIEVVKIPSLQHIRTINIAGSSPRNFLPVNDSVAYVTELYAKKIWIINYLSGNVISYITTNGWTEDMVRVGNFVFVVQKINSTQSGTRSRLLRVNASSNSLQGTTSFDGADLDGVVKDKFDRVWVALHDTAGGSFQGFACFDNNLMLQTDITFTTPGHHPTRPCVNPAMDRIYFADNGIYSISISDTVVPTTPMISTSGKNVYGLSVDPVTGDIYFSDALDYIQSSKIYRYDKNGSLIHSFTAGVISGNFAFYE